MLGNGGVVRRSAVDPAVDGGGGQVNVRIDGGVLNRLLRGGLRGRGGCGGRGIGGRGGGFVFLAGEQTENKGDQDERSAHQYFLPGGRLWRQKRVRVHRRAPPPQFLGGEDLDGEVQMGRAWGRVAGRADVADHLALLHELPFAQAVRVSLEMRVVVDP